MVKLMDDLLPIGELCDENWDFSSLVRKMRNTLIDLVVDVGEPLLPPQVLTGLWTADDRRLGLGSEDQTVQIYGIVEFLWPW